jgi:hypothetical protein
LQQCLFSVKIGTHKLEHSLPQSKIERTNFWAFTQSRSPGQFLPTNHVNVCLICSFLSSSLSPSTLIPSLCSSSISFCTSSISAAIWT